MERPRFRILAMTRYNVLAGGKQDQKTVMPLYFRCVTFCSISWPKV